VIRVRLRELMHRQERATGERVTYEGLAKKTGLSRATLEAIGSRTSYNPRISTIERLCAALDCTPAELLDYSPAGPRLRPKGRR
jgi:DNA-binding Xre family transcriptional regulator